MPDIEKYVNFYIGNNNINLDEFSNRFKTGCSGIRNVTQNYFHFSVWDYDELKRYLEDVGFKDVQKMKFGQTKNEKLNLDIKERAWETLYVEARK